MGGCMSSNAKVNGKKPLKRNSSGKIEESFISKGTFSSKYKMSDEVLGSGSFAVVRKCEERATGKVCAVKIIAKRKKGKETIEAEYLNDEVRILRRCGSHEHVLEIYDVYETMSSVYLVLELATGGSLLDRVLDAGKFSERDAANIVRQMTEAIGYLHSQHVVHRDLKPANLLLRDKDSFCVKVTDFGLSKSFEFKEKVAAASPPAKAADGSTSSPSPMQQPPEGALQGTSSHRDHQLLMQTACGSRAYAAPEVLDGDEYDQSVDIWGIGVIMAILLTGEHPMSDVPSDLMLHRMQQDKALDWSKRYWKNISNDAKQLLKRILKANPRDRITVKDMLADKWFTEAPETPLPHVLEGIKKLSLGGLQKLVLQLMATKVSDQATLAETKRLFDSLDVTKDGVVRKEEMDEVLKKQDTTDVYRAHLDALFQTLDLDGTGVVSLNELQAAMLTQQKSLMQSLLWPVFQHMDVEKNDRISAKEVVQVFGELGTDLSEDEVQKMIGEHDIDGTGTLNFSEFVKMMEQIMQEAKKASPGPAQ